MASGIKGLTQNQLTYLIILILRGVTEGVISAGSVVHPQPIDGLLFDGTKEVSHFGNCSSEGVTQTKELFLDGEFSRTKGARVYVKFDNNNVAVNPMLNVNNTGAASITFRGVPVQKNQLVSGRVFSFLFDGASYELVGSLDTETATSTAEGLVRLYSSLGSNENGAPTQKLFTETIAPLIKTIEANGDKLYITKQDGTVDQYTVAKPYFQATSSETGVVRLYSSTGTSVDGPMTQKAVTNELDTLVKTASSADGKISLVRHDGTSESFNLNSASSSVPGVVKIYEATGSATDGGVTQKCYTQKMEALDRDIANIREDIQAINAAIANILDGTSTVARSSVATTAHNIPMGAGLGNIYIETEEE